MNMNMGMDLRIGDELIEMVGPIAHKMVYVGPLGLDGGDVLNPAKGTQVHLLSLYSIPNWGNLRLGARGPESCYEQAQVQERARQVLQNRTVNRTFGPNCEHISSYVRTGKTESPQLKFWGGTAAVAALIWLLAA